MNFDTVKLESANIKLVDGDRGKNYPKQKDFKPEGHCLFLSAKNVTRSGFEFSEKIFINEERDNLLRAGKLQRGDIVVTTRGTIGNVALFDDAVDFEHVRINSGMIIVRANPNEWDSKFLYFLFTSSYIQNQIASLTSGSAVPQLPARDIKKFDIPKISIEAQRAIAGIAGSIVEKEILNRQINQTLEQIAHTLFKSWFVDFDPVRAKVAVREYFEQCAVEQGTSLPTSADMEESQNIAAAATIAGLSFDPSDIDGTRAMLEVKLAEMEGEQRAELRSLAAEFPASFDEDEYGVIPSGWSFRPFGDLLQSQIGGDWGKEEADEKHTESVRIIRGTDIPKILNGEVESVPGRVVEKKKLAKRALEDGDIAIEVSGGSKDQSTGRSLYITADLLRRFDSPVEPASFCRLFRPKSKELGAYLAVHLSCIYDAGKMWSYQNQSTGISNFQTKYFLETEPVVIPAEGVLGSFSQIAKNVYAKKFSPENSCLAKLREALLPKLVSGEIQLNSEFVAEAS
ncbi:restriction endonuclease subunit S [Microbulbifer elongatus]|uniref:restriction endonuclease subunit S n=1 Tax=Microbulbifer elongatus TaxID=86173 RepID=UPI001CFE62FB|nr:restriction endonuclease subunit S [Microbulbifer elongatus]